MAAETAGEAAGEVLGLEGNPFIEGDGLTQIFVVNADAVVLRYLVEPGIDTVFTLDDRGQRFGGPPPNDAEVYDWVTGEFLSAGWPAQFGSKGTVSAAGEVVVRLVFENREFSEVFPSTFKLEWEAS